MAWGMIATLAGPEGPQGPTGAQGPAGAQGAQGPAGEDGAGIEIAGSVATYAALPSNLGTGDAGDGDLVEADGKLYIWSGTAFPASGSGVEFRGPAGPEGPAGAQGATGAAGAQGGQGATGATGATGPRGTKWFTGSGAPTSLTGQQAGDLYLDTDDGSVYELT